MERQCARPVRRWSICLNGQRHRPAAHNGRVGCQGHKSISRKRSKVARCIEARETAARRGFRSSRALLPDPFDDSLRLDAGGGEEEIRFTLRQVSKENISNISLLRTAFCPWCCLDVGGRGVAFSREKLFRWIVSSQMSTVIIFWYSSVTRCRIIYYCTWKFWLEPYKISVTGRKGTKCPFTARQRYCFIGDVRTNKKKRRKKQKKRECEDNERIETIAPAAIRILVTVFRNRF